MLTAFLATWGDVLLGRRSLVPGDVLYLFYPWHDTVGAHVARNSLLSDLALEIHPWFTIVRHQLLHGHVPLWNSYAAAGSPLLANGQSAVFSPFTLAVLPLPPSYALSLAMLLKLWVAGLGTWCFLRRLGLGGVAAAAGGLAFAASSYMVVWLGWPHAGVAALMPWAFAATEWYLRSRRPLALSVLGGLVGVQFFAGHPETSLHFGLGLTIYILARCVGLRRDGARPLLGLALAAALGVGLGLVQLLPLAEHLSQAGIGGARASAGLGLIHLPLPDINSWIAPNRLGNPGFDGRDGPFPNYNEATGFAGAWALVAAPFGLAWLWRRQRSAAIGLAVIGLFAAGVVYGLLSPVVGRLPLLAVSPNTRFIVDIDFALACLAGCGVQSVLDLVGMRRGERRAAVPLLLLAGAGLAVEVVVIVLFLERGSGVDNLLGQWRKFFVFWLVPGGAAVVCAAALIGVGRWGRMPRLAGAGLMALALCEALLFAGPYNVGASPGEVPPPSRAMTWMHDHAGDRPVAFTGDYSPPGAVASPESSSLFQMHDVASYDPLLDTRHPQFWSGGDPRLGQDTNHMLLGSPSVSRLRQAGVIYVMSVASQVLPGTLPRYSKEGVTISEVPEAPARVYSAASVLWVPGRPEAAAALGPALDGEVVVERAGAPGSVTGTGPAETVTLDRAIAGEFDISTRGATPAVVVVNESYSRDWVARVDGIPVVVHPANLIRMAVVVPAGQHQLTLRYEPASFRAGALVSALSLLLLLALPLGAAALGRRPRGRITSILEEAQP